MYLEIFFRAKYYKEVIYTVTLVRPVTSFGLVNEHLLKTAIASLHRKKGNISLSGNANG